MPPIRPTAVLVGCLLASLHAAAAPGLHGAEPAPVATSAHRIDRAAIEDRFRKAHILGSDRWRRARFEFDAWLRSESAYTPAQAAAVAADLDRRVAMMTSYEVEYLMDTLDAKLHLLATPAARDARAWLGRYLAVMADHRREEVLAALPNVLDMTTADLAAGVDRLRATRTAVERAAADTLRGRRQFAAFVQEQRGAVEAQRAARGRIRMGETAWSPYRSRPAADPPFAGTADGQPFAVASPWGPLWGIQVGGF